MFDGNPHTANNNNNMTETMTVQRGNVKTANELWVTLEDLMIRFASIDNVNEQFAGLHFFYYI